MKTMMDLISSNTLSAQFSVMSSVGLQVQVCEIFWYSSTFSWGSVLFVCFFPQIYSIFSLHVHWFSLLHIFFFNFRYYTFHVNNVHLFLSVVPISYPFIVSIIPFIFLNIFIIVIKNTCLLIVKYGSFQDCLFYSKWVKSFWFLIRRVILDYILNTDMLWSWGICFIYLKKIKILLF